jgi:hypothetical protein
LRVRIPLSPSPAIKAHLHLTIPVLRHLVTHSLTEDTLGTIQRDIPKVLESLCGYLSVVEGAREELGKKIGLDFKIDEAEGVESTNWNAIGGEGGVDAEKREEILRGLAEIEPLRVGKSFSSLRRFFFVLMNGYDYQLSKKPYKALAPLLDTD